jgi:peroxiredoxin
MKIKKGDLIKELSLPAIDGSVFDLNFVQGQKLMISFYRYSSCPFCHLRINETINNKDNFGDNFQTVAIFNCNIESLQKGFFKT